MPGAYEDKYGQILDMPHHVSENHAQMSMRDRAAQFSPFAALTGYDRSIAEEGRLTESITVLDDDRKAYLDMCVAFLEAHADECPEVSVEYFVPDPKKSGGAYKVITGHFARTDSYEKKLFLTDGTGIYIPYIRDLTGEIFFALHRT